MFPLYVPPHMYLRLCYTELHSKYIKIVDFEILGLKIKKSIINPDLKTHHMNFKQNIVESLIKETGLEKEDVEKLLEVPPDDKLGDYAFPCFVLSKKLKKNPVEIAQELTEKLKQTLSDKGVNKLEHKGAYLNFFINKELLAKQTIELIEEQKLNMAVQNRKINLP